MKNLGLAVLAALFLLVGCTPDRTLETLVPRKALVVVLADHPTQAGPLLGSGVKDLPWKALDGNKPWAAAVLPANPPGFFLALALADKEGSWAAVQSWAKERGGLEAVRLGSYAVLSSPGLPTPEVLDTDSRFDLDRVRADGDPVAAYFDVKNLMGEADFPEALRPAFGAFPWAEKNLSGLRLGLSGKDGGLVVRLATDWKSTSAVVPLLKPLSGRSVDLGPWTGLLPMSDGLGGTADIPPALLTSLGTLSPDPALTRRWETLVPLLGPRVSWSAVPHSDGTWTWAAAVESKDPQAIRQALKTLVAGGDLQRNFPAWAIDTDTPLIYRDQPDGAGGIRTEVTLGAQRILVAYGKDRVAFASGPGAKDALGRWSRSAPSIAPWFHEAASGASAVFTGRLEGLGASGSLSVRDDGNLEFKAWVGQAGLKAWEERLPQALLRWLSAEGGLTRMEP